MRNTRSLVALSDQCAPVLYLSLLHAAIQFARKRKTLHFLLNLTKTQYKKHTKEENLKKDHTEVKKIKMQNQTLCCKKPKRCLDKQKLQVKLIDEYSQ
jgi:hypothetical protein